MTDQSFSFDAAALSEAVNALGQSMWPAHEELPAQLPDAPLGDRAALQRLAPHVLGEAARLDAPDALAHMDPPTPWLSWALTLWNARLNQNLLHPSTSPFARRAEELAVSWLAPFFGMDGGHTVPGSTVANLTGIWAAREVAGATRVVASEAAHLSIGKAAHLLGMKHDIVPTDPQGRLAAGALRDLGDLSDACLVLTAGTTATGMIDPLDTAGRAAWTHVDAAWGGPLRLTRYASRLDGIEHADSAAVSAHKWFFQPKDSALVFFRDSARAHDALSFGADYLTVPNVGVLGSHGAAAIPLLGTLLAWGRSGAAARIESCMAIAGVLEDRIRGDSRLELFGPSATGVVVFRPRQVPVAAMRAALDPATVSSAVIGGETWLRCVAANPLADVERVYAAIDTALARA